MKIISKVFVGSMLFILSTAVEAQTIDRQSLVNGYLAIKNALVKSNVSEVQSAAKALRLIAEGDEKLESSTKKIALSSDLGQQRILFSELSNLVYTELKNNGTTELTLYKQFCPMALNNSGASWLSTSQEIENPYFGNMMLRCGSVQEVLN